MPDDEEVIDSIFLSFFFVHFKRIQCWHGINFFMIDCGLYITLNLQLFAGNDADEFSSILKKERTPKVLITTCRFNSTVSFLN